MKRGEPLQAIYRRRFKHRYGGNAPAWRHLSSAEQNLWSEVEGEYVTGLPLRTLITLTLVHRFVRWRVRRRRA